jgi:hypothetical protein
MAVEPWPGYQGMTQTRRRELLEFKIDEARLRWDLLTAQLIAAAVANYEALERLEGEPTEVEKAAESYAGKIKRSAARGFSDEAGGWGHGISEEAGGWGHG